MTRAHLAIALASIIAATCHDVPRSPVSVAASAGDVESLQRAVRSAATANSHDPDGWTPLIWATREGQPDAVHFLLIHGADPNLVDKANRWTPLLHAVHRHQRAVAEQLLLAGAKPNQAVAEGLTPLMMAAGYGDAEAVRLLLAHGADPARRDGHGESALDYALAGISDIDDFTIFKCQDEAARALLAGGARLEGTHADKMAQMSARMKHCGKI